MMPTAGTPRQAAIRRIAAGCGAALVVLGSAVVAGWLFNLPVIREVIPGSVTMKFNTAIGFIIAGFAIRRLAHRTSPHAPAISLAVLAGATLLQHVFTINLGFDQLVVRDLDPVLSGSGPGRMSPITAVCFLLLGTGLALPERRPLVRLGIAVTVFAHGMVGLLEHSYHVGDIFMLGGHTRMAVHTAAAFLVAGVGVAFASPGAGFIRLLAGESSGSAMTRRLLPMVLVIPPLVSGMLLHGVHGRFWGLEFGMACAVATTMALVAWMVILVGYRLQRLDEDRKAQADELLQGREVLRRAEKMDAIGRLAGGVVHDFNNALTVIIGQAELLTTTATSDAVRRRVAAISRAADHASAITAQLLSFSRHRPVALHRANLNALVRDAEPMLDSLVGEPIALTISASATPGEVLANVDQLTQVLVNLVANARDAMPAGGGVWVSIADIVLERMHGAVPAGRWVRLAVTDTGTGMDAATQERIFEPFFTTKPVGRGTGLGLAQVYAIVRAHDGHVAVESAPGCGTAVSVYLPPIPALVTAAA